MYYELPSAKANEIVSLSFSNYFYHFQKFRRVTLRCYFNKLYTTSFIGLKCWSDYQRV